MKIRSLLTLITLTTFSTVLLGQKTEPNSPAAQSTDQIKSTNLKVVSSYFEYLFKTRDFAAMSKIISKDNIYTQAEGLPYGGTYVGFEELTKMFTKASSYFDLKIEKEPVYYSNPNDNNIIISFTIRCTAKTTGKDIVMPILEHFEVRDGLITAIRPFYFDTKMFSEFVK
jgi:ketosteroid isomerase-like protein